MLEISLFIALLVLGVRAFLALRRESKTLREFSQSAELDWLVLACPLGPIALLVGLPFLPQFILLILVAAYYAYVLIAASRADFKSSEKVSSLLLRSLRKTIE